MANVADGAQLESYYEHGDVQGDSKIGDQKGKRVAEAAGGGHHACHGAANPRRAATGKGAIVGKRFGETHRDTRADAGGHTDEKRVPTFVGGESRGEKRSE